MSEPMPGRHAKRRFRRLRREVDLLRHGTARAHEVDDEFAEISELRITALEEILFARWPRSIAVRRRLRRDLRASVAHVQGDTFTDRRFETVSTGWVKPLRDQR
jgi:hypothetical protein